VTRAGHEVRTEENRNTYSFIFSSFRTSNITQKYNYTSGNTAWPHTQVSRVAAPNRLPRSIYSRRFAQEKGQAKYRGCYKASLYPFKILKTGIKKADSLFCPALPDIRPSTAFCKVTRLRPPVLLIKVVLRYKWVRSFAGMIPGAHTRRTGRQPVPMPL
jgi:hypothetical protein